MIGKGDIYMHFADKLRTLRKEKGLTQLELAKKINISNTVVSQWELGNAHPSLEAFANLVKALGVSADYFLFDNVPPEGVAAIDDFELYEHFRKTENLAKGKKEMIKEFVDAIVFKEKIKEIPESDFPKAGKERENTPLRKVAGKR